MIGHECYFKKGKIIDVTVRDNKWNFSIHCRQCGSELKQHQVEDKMLERIYREHDLGGKFQ